MAYFLDSFRNSSMPKRLLRYALSRFDILDADALNLDNLDLAWGMKTVLEFRDVGLKLKKLHQLLQLPPNFHIRRAKVALLRVTLPVDIFSSPIQIQVAGVDVRLKISKEVEDGGSRRKDKQGNAAEDDGAVPSAEDLAESFLEQQPSNEKKALEEALVAAVEEEDEYDDDDNDSASSSSQTLGTGQTLTLPGFLAGFLQGIVDRIQLNIEGVTFQLEVDVPVDTKAANAVTAAIPTASPESVTFELSLARINVEGVTTSITAPTGKGEEVEAGQGKDQPEPTRPAIVPKEGKRHISLENVRAFLISEANVFSTLARSPSMPSSVSSQSPSIPAREPPLRSSAASVGHGFSSRAYQHPSEDLEEKGEEDDGYRHQSASLAASSVASSALLQSRYALQDSEDAFNIPYDLESSGDENDSTAHEPFPPLDSTEEADTLEGVPSSSLSTPRASVYGDITGPSARSFSPPLQEPPSDARAAQSAVVEGGQGGLQWSAWRQEAQSEPSLRPTAASSSPTNNERGGLGLGPADAPLEDSFHSSSGGNGSTGSPGNVDDLAASHMFSHEEAESMYMSAFSQSESVRLRGAMPGGWDSEHAEDDHDHHSGNQSPLASAVLGHFGSSNNPDLSTQLPMRPATPPATQESSPSSTNIQPAASVASIAPEPTASGILEKELESSVHAAGSPPAELSDALDDSEEQESQSQPDEAATPRGPARLVKEILALNYISVYIPSTHKQINIPQPNPNQAHHRQQRHENLGKSVSPHLPGAFSIYSSAGASTTLGDTSIHTRLDESQHQQSHAPHDHGAHNPDDKSVEVTLAPLEVRFDASIGFLLAMVATELLRSLKAGFQMQQQQQQQQQQQKPRATQPVAAPGGDATSTASLVPEIKFRAERISLLFLDKLAGVADTAERFFDSSKAANFNQGNDVLLQAVFEDLVVGLCPPSEPSAVKTAVTKSSVDLKRFRFGYSDADILSFDRRIQMRASVRDVFPPAGDDISVKLSQSENTTKCEINTLPLLISIDLQRLDETFSWFGGLSSFLSMGSSSMSSVASQSGGVAGGGGGGKPVTLPMTKLAEAPQKPRGVRFEAPINPDDRSAAAENKVDMRIGGVRLDLIGKDCSVGLDTSAVKLVNREEGIGVGVSRIRLAGPYLRNSRGEPPITAEVANTRLEFLNVPKDKDLERLLELITPSRVKFDEREDVIMVDTLLRQRRSGPLLRLNVDDLNVHVHNIAQLSCLPALGEEVARLATVAKYLPEDDRPGLLTLGLVRRVDLSADIGGRLGLVQASIADFETAHITIPSLVSVAVGSLSVHRNHTEELIGSSAVSSAAVTPTSTSTAVTATTVLPSSSGQSPALMLRIIGNDMEPVIKVKMWGLNFEYRVPTIMDVLGLAEDTTPQDFEASLAASVANLGEQAHTAITSGLGAHESTASTKGKNLAGGHGKDNTTKPTTVDLAFRDCVVGLNPLGLTSKLNIVLVDARLEVVLPQQDEEIDAVAHFNKMSLLLTDDISAISSAKQVAFVPGHANRRSSGGAATLTPATLSKDMVSRLCARGFVDVCQISAAKISVHVSAADDDGQKTVDLEVRDDLLVLETCADSTQTLITLANALKPPTPPSKEIKFKTQVMPVKDLLASISIDAFGRAEGNYNIDEDFILEEDEYDDGYGEGTGGGSDEDLYGAGSGGSNLLLTDQGNRAAEQSVASLPSVTADDDDLLLADDDLDVEGRMAGTVAEKLFSASSIFSDDTEIQSTARRQHLREQQPSIGKEKPAASPLGSSSVTSELGIEENFFGTAADTAAEEASHTNRWSSAQNNYDKAKNVALATGKPPPLRVRVRDVHVIWNLYDGYDWEHTRDIIAKTVEEVEAKAYERRTRHRRRSGHDQYNPYSDDEEEETVIGDFLFNSIYIGIPATHDPRELTQAINQNIYGDTTVETESVAATTVTATSSRPGGSGGPGHHHGSRSRSKKLKLNRSRHHKITFELGGVGADLVVYPPGSGETQSSIDVRVRDLDIFDHVPTSTWKKFATYDRDAGERPIDGDMVHLEVLIVKPVPELAATEFVLKASLLPLRLHVDQDALDFITRFFEFKDDTAAPTHASPSDIPFIQRAEIRDIPVQMDFKPKRVDYAGLRSGHTTEFMNFLILESSRMVLRHTIIYGISGFDRLGKTLNDIWMPDIKRHQLPGVLAGLAPVRSLVTVGSGFRDLIEIPIQEYRHNGRIVRSISKGAMAFAKSTGTELVKLGAKVATGTQYVLQGAEGMLNKNNEGAYSVSGDAGGGGGGDDNSDEERKQISLYADQPTDVVQGLRHAYGSLARDLHIARDAIIAVPAEVRESTSATGAAKAVLKHAPTIVFRPAIGATKAIGQTLLGATNSLDPQNLRRAEDKYKSGPGRT